MEVDPSSTKNEVIKLTQELVRIKSVNPPGDELPAAELNKRLSAYGLETELVEVDKNRANVIAVLKGRGKPRSHVQRSPRCSTGGR